MKKAVAVLLRPVRALAGTGPELIIRAWHKRLQLRLRLGLFSGSAVLRFSAEL